MVSRGALYFLRYYSDYFVDSLRKSIVLLIIVQIVAPLTNSIMAALFPMSTDRYIYDTYIDIFGPMANVYVWCLGIVIYFILKKMNISKMSLQQRKSWSYLLLIFSLIMLYGQINGSNKLYSISYYDMYGIWFGIIIISQALYSCSIIVNPIFRMCGKYSYGIYLFQFIWIRFYNRYIHMDLGNPILCKFILSVLGLLTVSYILTRFYDAPIQEKLKRMV